MLLSVRPSSACPSVAYIANNSRTRRPSVPKFKRKVHHLRCDSHTSFKVKQSKVRVGGGRGHTVSAEPGAHTACYIYNDFTIVRNRDDGMALPGITRNLAIANRSRVSCAHKVNFQQWWRVYGRHM